MRVVDRVLTDRLDLRRPDPIGDLDELFVIFSDPAGWWYDRAGRHTEPRYRIAAGEQGQGFATELARAVCFAASSIDAGVPFIAWIAPHNAPSRKVAERLGLTNYGLDVDPSDGQHRLAYADRPPSSARLP